MPFGLGKSTPSEDVASSDQVPADDGKGRPTPKRADARQARRNPTSSTSRTAARGGTRGASKDVSSSQRERNREERRRAYEALRGGDERFLPPRDAGPERRHARDYVDSRFTLGQVLLPTILGVFVVGTFVPYRLVQSIASFAGLIALVAIVLDSMRHGRGANQAVAERFRNSAIRGITSYAFLLAMLPRRFRRPPPKVARGGAAL